MRDPESFSAILQRSLDKQKAKQRKNREAMAVAVREVLARKQAAEVAARLTVLGLDVDPNEDRAGIPWGGGR